MNSPRHFRTLFDVSGDEFHRLLRLATAIKADLKSGSRPPVLAGQTLALLFEKPSLRTRISFEAGMAQLGGQAIYLSADVGWKSRESISDFVRVLAEYCDAMVCRANTHETVIELASYDCISIVNGLTDQSHPCQALADLLTMQEISGELSGQHLVFVGDGNNVARSVLHACAIAGVHFTLIGPQEYWFDQEVIDRLTEGHSIRFDQSEDCSKLSAADFIYTDVWVSMGQEAEADQRKKVFCDYQLNAMMLSGAPPHAKILHCLPAHRGLEITDDVIDGLQSVVIAQAGNRMHAQKALLVWLAYEAGRIQQLPPHWEAILRD